MGLMEDSRVVGDKNPSNRGKNGLIVDYENRLPPVMNRMATAPLASDTSRDVPVLPAEGTWRRNIRQ